MLQVIEVLELCVLFVGILQILEFYMKCCMLEQFQSCVWCFKLIVIARQEMAKEILKLHSSVWKNSTCMYFYSIVIFLSMIV